MKRFRVEGKGTFWISCEVELSDKELKEIEENETDLSEIVRDKAYDVFGGLHHFAGNGGMDKLIGVTESTESIDFCEEYEFTDVTEL